MLLCQHPGGYKNVEVEREREIEFAEVSIHWNAIQFPLLHGGGEGFAFPSPQHPLLKICLLKSAGTQAHFE